MTERLYYRDAYATHCDARILERGSEGSHKLLVLDRTVFYPTSGGQPHDLGDIDGLPVVDVRIRPRDGAIDHHVLGDLPAGRSVRAQIDWARRFDHMQQHSGQHVLSQAFLRVADTATVGFHLGEDASTIDLDRDDMAPGQIEEAESLANQVIWEDRALRVHFVSASEARQLPLRKVPPIDQGKLRLVEIADFDWSACGGTHVARTGAIGQIKIARLERRAGKLRVTFLCGVRALNDYRKKNLLVTRLMGEFTTGQDEILAAVDRLRAENTEWRRQARRQQAEMARLEAALLRRSTPEAPGEPTIFMRAFEEGSAEYMRQVAGELLSEPATVVLFGLAGKSSQLLLARSDDVSADMSQLIKSALQVLGTTAGGGTPSYAQGGGSPADMARVQAALARAERVLRAQSGGTGAR